MRYIIRLGLFWYCCVSAANALGATATSEYENALLELEQGNAVEAAIALKRGLQNDPRHVPSIVLLGEIYLDNALWTASEAAFRQALALGAAPTRVYRLLARSLLAQHRAKDLLAELDPNDVVDEARAEIHALRGEAYLYLDDFAGLRRELDQPQTRGTATFPIQLLRVPLLLHNEDYAAAEQQALKLTQTAPHRTEAWNVAASVAHQSGQTDIALQRYNRAIDLDANNGDARIGRMSLLVDEGRESEIGDDLDYFARVHPDEPRANYFRSLFLARKGEHDAAREALQQVVSVISQLHEVQLRGGNRTLLVVSALAQYGLGQFNASAQNARAFLDRQAGDLGVIKLLGDALIRGNRSADALVELLPAIERQPNDTTLLVLASTAMSNLNDYEGASALLQRAISISNLPDLETRRANMEIGAGRIESGTRILQGLLDKKPDYGTAGIALIVAYMGDERYDRAAEVAERFLQTDADNLAVRNLLGVAYAYLGRTEAAENLFRQCVADEPNFAPAAVNLARFYRARGEYSAAVQEIEKLIAQRDRSVELLVELSRIYAAQGNDALSLSTAEQAYRTDPDDLDTAVHYTQTLLAAEDDIGADRLTRELLRSFPSQPEIAALRVDYLLLVGNLQAARLAANDLYRKAGNNLTWLLRTAEYQSRQGWHDDAATTLVLAQNYHPDSLPVTLGLIESYLHSDRADRALEVINTNTQGFDDTPEFILLRGEALLANNQLAAALADFKHLQEAYQLDIAAVRRAHTLALLNRLAEAETVLEQQLQTQPDSQVVRESLADLQLATGKPDLATTHYQALIATQPQRARLHNNLAVGLEQLGRLQDAIASARRATELQPNNASYNDTLGWALFRDAQADTALPYLREASVRDFANPTIRMHLVQCLAALGRHREALSILREGLDQFPQFSRQPGVADLLRDLSDAAS